MLGPLTRDARLQDGEVTDKNCSVAVVGKDMPFTLLEDESLAPYIAGGPHSLFQCCPVLSALLAPLCVVWGCGLRGFAHSCDCGPGFPACPAFVVVLALLSLSRRKELQR